jgi:hypothetical protein
MWNASQWFRLTQLLLLVLVITVTEHLLGDRLTVIYSFYNIFNINLWHEKVSRHYLGFGKIRLPPILQEFCSIFLS